MYIHIKKNASASQKKLFLSSLERVKYNYDYPYEHDPDVIRVNCDCRGTEAEGFLAFDCVEKVEPEPLDRQKALRKCGGADTIINVKGVKIGGGYVEIIAGPCSIENHVQAFRIAKKLSAIGIKWFRGGAYKPRTSPYSFQGLNVEGLKILRSACDEYEMSAVTELLDVRNIDIVAKYADIIQIGTRNASNYALLKEVGKLGKPVLLKRGVSSTIKEFLLSAEYIMSQGNDRVILCERGIRTFETSYRTTLDIAAISIIKSMSHLPVIADPSHSSGNREFVASLTYASIAACADGVMIEVHDKPEEALSDAKQSIKPETLIDIIETTSKLCSCFDRKFQLPKRALKKETEVKKRRKN